MELWPLSYETFESFLLVLTRTSVLLFVLPFFSSRVIPARCKAGLALAISISLFPVMNRGYTGLPDNLWGMGQMIIAEFITGMILGLLVQVFFEGVRMMGQLVGFQTGFAITNILDPQSGIQVSILANLAYFTAMVLFLSFDGHHIMLRAMKESFQIIPPGSLAISGDLVQEVINLAGDMFVIALKIGAPAIAVLFFTKVAFGLVVKLIPQMNIMIVAFPVQIVLGLIFFGICLGLLSRFLDIYMDRLGPLLINTMNIMKG